MQFTLLFSHLVILSWFTGIKKYNILDPEIKEVVRSDAIFATGIYGDTGDRLPPPPVPARGKSLRKKEENAGNEDDLYEHYVKIKDVHRTKNDQYTKMEGLQNMSSASDSSPQSSNSAALIRFNHANLSVKDVGDILKKLKLGKFVKRFKSEMIDGEILTDLTRNILINEFNFSHIEAIRLEKFIASGHVPA